MGRRIYYQVSGLKLPSDTRRHEHNRNTKISVFFGITNYTLYNNFFFAFINLKQTYSGNKFL